MFSGTYDYKVDEKGRMPVPPKFRQDLKGDVVLLRGIEKCIWGYSAQEFQKMVDALGQKPLPAAKMRKLKRALMSSAFSLEIDNQGRVMLPYALRQHAGIADDVVVIGTGNNFELWNPELWRAEDTTDTEEAWQIIESLDVQDK